MKWLLVTTNQRPHQPNTKHPHGAGWNVGDVFAYLGTAELVREVDPNAEIALVNMDDAASITTPQKFDRAVFAGRPMFWRGAERHPLWTNLINGWLCAEPRKVMALGVGDCWPLNDPNQHTEWEAQAARAKEKMFAIVARSFGVRNTIRGVCPATWILRPKRERPLRLVNFMPLGAHYPDFDRRGAELWRACQPTFAGLLRELGFEFVAHTAQEQTLAQMLGWEESRIHVFDNAEDYIDLYERAQIYIGNRVHGGLVLCGGPAAVTVFGNDTRLHAVTCAGGYAAPFDVAALATIKGCARPRHYHPGSVENHAAVGDDRIARNLQHRTEARRLLAEFAS